MHVFLLFAGQVEMLLSSEKEIDGQKPRFLNDLDVDDSGAVYFSDSSTKWDRRRFLYLVFENKPLGRLALQHTKKQIFKQIHSFFLISLNTR